MASRGGKLDVKRPRGLELLRQVYAELHQCLGDDYTASELLRAAQSLIDISNIEYASETYQDGIHYPGYYSNPVDVMIASRPWSVYAAEGGHDDDPLLPPDEVAQRLRRLHRPDRFHPHANGDLSA
jgi:hypothetical protein